MIRGPLVDRSDPLPEPTRFTVLYGTVIEVAALDEERLDVETTCHRLRRLRPLTAANTFTGECTPIYTADAAEVLLTVLEGGYTAEG